MKVRSGGLLHHEDASEEDGLGAETDGVADPAGALEPGAAATAVAECVHRDA